MKVGDYVSTKYGIAKITKIVLNVNTCEIDRQLNDFYFVLNENIIKSSPNIIDLIEVGDYVNGERVVNIIKKHKYLEVSDEEIIIEEEDIKSIVTKEQFESMEYKINKE